jgi:glycerol-3-phosphate dehydrogenase subunit B
MTRSLLVIGAGLAGLFASVLAARRGAAVRLIAEGRGGLTLSHGCIDLWRNGDLRFSLAGLDRTHPLRLAGWPVVESSFAAFLEFMQEARLPYAGRLDRSWRLPTALGAIHVTAGAPVSLASGSLDDPEPVSIGRLKTLRDFSAPLVAAGLRSQGVDVRGIVELDLPPPGSPRDLYPQEVAALFDSADYRHQVVSVWKPRLRGVRRLGLPAILGRDQALEAFASLETELGVEPFEIPTLPPSLPGLRVERALRRLAVEAGVDLIEGPSVRGEVDGRSAGKLVSGAVATTAGGPRGFRADAALLATGGALHGGWLSFANGEVQEAVFGLPIESSQDREAWVAPSLYQEQPFARLGLRVDARFRPCDRKGRPYFENLFAAGGLLGGSDRTFEGSRQAIDLASAFSAVEAALS